MVKNFNKLDYIELIELIKSGAIGVLPTDTVYGLVGSARMPSILDQINVLKGREQKAGTILAGSVDQLIDFGLDPLALNKVAHLWPNPISVVIDCDTSVINQIQGSGSVAVRIPANEQLRSLLLATGPLVTSSANLSGKQVVSNIEQATKIFGENVNFYVDGGDLSGSAASTIVKLSADRLSIIRQGSYELDFTELAS
ncbi:MAG: L-threonylcarbamoyladenylate synthase [Candidatus Saccharibacteria bacterium]|nr:L-threonylcarbamoyladenylate synthase [Candidatus Saccharibacteria bacterium]